ncbi:MAG TPA: hypothetical protein VM617_00635 [Thermoanaerobaculia bacterium]|nr:hypothetical protein [Thermoanaerobaculia bacterium]
MPRATAILTQLILTLVLVGCDGSDGPTKPRDEGVFLMRACRGSEHAPQGELFRALLRGPELVAEAESRIVPGISPIYLNGQVLRGDGGFNAPWSWHHDPAQTRFVEGVIEACEGCPSFVEDDIDYWVDNLGHYCPFVEVLRRER